MSTETPEQVTHLWEVDHPYYCSESNFRVRGTDNNANHVQHESWAEFMDGWGGSDPDMNLLFRWDWHSWSRHPDPHLRSDSPDELLLFFMLQRKGDFWVCSVAITDEDEPAVRAWLADRAKTIAAIWAPIDLAEAAQAQKGGTP